ncbi:kinase-like domain-containing protein [Astrocystis sublimbata]|nr:kinase-like domain-containing protein [Astrocystis sublimbata]
MRYNRREVPSQLRTKHASIRSVIIQYQHRAEHINMEVSNSVTIGAISIRPHGADTEMDQQASERNEPTTEITEITSPSAGSAASSETSSPGLPPEPKRDENAIYELFSRKVIRDGDKAIKVNARGIRRDEAAVMHFVREHTTIPVPRVYATTPTSITMDFVEGTTLQESWNDLTDEERTNVSDQLRDYLTQLRAVKGSYIGGFARGPAIDSRLFDFEGGPFETEAEWNEFLLEGLVESCPPALRSMLSTQLRTDHEIVLTHGDLHATNIMVRDGRIVALIDWENAGFYPEYLDLIKPLRGPKWRVGYYGALIDIFPKRYDAEYIADQFLSRISSR